MKISTKGIYALEVIVDLAIHSNQTYCKYENIKNIAMRRNLSEKYLERIISLLKKEGIVTSVRGAYGGYYLTKEPKDILISDILAAVEGDLAPVECLRNETNCKIDCNKCTTRHLWNEMWMLIKEVVDNTTVQDLLNDINTN